MFHVEHTLFLAGPASGQLVLTDTGDNHLLLQRFKEATKTPTMLSIQLRRQVIHQEDAALARGLPQQSPLCQSQGANYQLDLTPRQVTRRSARCGPLRVVPCSQSPGRLRSSTSASVALLSQPR